MMQTITPNPRIPCKPGWCLAYVNEAYGVRKVYGSATAAWRASATKHHDYNFPAGCWVPVWFALSDEPNGHVALLAPDGSVYSTSDNSTTPHHHPDLADLIGYYAYYGMRLTYLGWTEDVEGTPVITAAAGITTQGTTVKEKGFLMALTDRQQEDIYWMLCAPDGRQFLADLVGGRAAEKTLHTAFARQGSGLGGETTLAAFVAWNDSHVEAIISAVHAVAPTADLEAIRAAVREGLAGSIEVNATVTVKDAE